MKVILSNGCLSAHSPERDVESMTCCGEIDICGIKKPVTLGVHNLDLGPESVSVAATRTSFNKQGLTSPTSPIVRFSYKDIDDQGGMDAPIDDDRMEGLREFLKFVNSMRAANQLNANLALRDPLNSPGSSSCTSPIIQVSYKDEDDQDGVNLPVDSDRGLHEFNEQLWDGTPVSYTVDDAEGSDEEEFDAYKRKSGHTSYPANAEEPQTNAEQLWDGTPVSYTVDEDEGSSDEDFYSYLRKYGHISYPANAQEPLAVDEQLWDGTPVSYTVDEDEGSSDEDFYSYLRKYGHISYPANAQEPLAVDEQLWDGTATSYTVDEDEASDEEGLQVDAQVPPRVAEQFQNETPILCPIDEAEESDDEECILQGNAPEPPSVAERLGQKRLIYSVDQRSLQVKPVTRMKQLFHKCQRKMKHDKNFLR